MTSYANPGGTGDRTATITVTTDASLGGSSGPASKLVDGNKANGSGSAIWFVNGQSGRRIVFNFTGLGAKQIIDEAKWYQNGPTAHGTWKWQRSDDGSSWVDLSAPFTLDGGGVGDVIGDLSANVNAYWYYSILQTSGTTSDSPWDWEIEFKLEAGASESEPPSDSESASEPPSDSEPPSSESSEPPSSEPSSSEPSESESESMSASESESESEEPEPLPLPAQTVCITIGV